jgi:hypothetical protein
MRAPGQDDVRVLAEAIAKGGVEYAVISGAVMALHGFPHDEGHRSASAGGQRQQPAPHGSTQGRTRLALPTFYQLHRFELVLRRVRRSLAFLSRHFVSPIPGNLHPVKKYVFQGQRH